MTLHYYRIRAINPELLAVIPQPHYWDICANSLESAWRKFTTQRFGVLKPNPSHYDIRHEYTKSV